MRRQFGRIQRDAHRHALHQLDPVAGGVLRGQDGERRAGAGAHADHPAMVGLVAAVEIGVHGHRLADAHALELDFLEVGVDPDAGQRHHGHQRAAGTDSLARLDGALGDDAIDRRDDRSAAVIDVGLVELRRRRRDGGVAGNVAAGDAGEAGRKLLADLGQLGFGTGEAGGGMRDFLIRDGASGGDAPPARQIVAGPRHLDFAVALSRA